MNNTTVLKDDSYFAEFRDLLPAANKYTYMNSAGCGPLAKPVLDRMCETFTYMADEGQVNVKVHDELKKMLEDIRKDVSAFINAEPEEIFFVRCIAEGLNTISRMFPLEKGDCVLISDQENPASIMPFFVMEPTHGICVDKFCGLGSKEDIIRSCKNAMNNRTKILCASHVFHTTGAAIPAKEICEIAREKGIITVLDGAQAAGNIRIDVKEIGCDFYCLSCHKWLCGPEGIAAVYISKDMLQNAVVPFGGQGVQRSFDFENDTIDFQPDARRFEYGGRHTPMYTAFSETIKLANKIGLDQMIARKEMLHNYCRGQFTALLPQVQIISPEDERLRTGIFSFRIPGMDHRQVVKRAWNEEKMIIQWRTLNLITNEEGIRVSLNWFITKKEIDKLVRFIGRIVAEEVQ